MRPSLRPAKADDLGLRRALSDRLLPLLVTAMTILAALTLAGAIAAAGLARHWRGGAATLVTVQVPDPSDAAPGGTTRAVAVARLLEMLQGRGGLGVSGARLLTEPEVGALLKPWLGVDAAALSLKLPAVFEVRMKYSSAAFAAGAADAAFAAGAAGAGFAAGAADAAFAAGAAGLDAALARVAPGTLVERNGVWLSRLTGLAASLQACAAVALAMVAFIAAAVVALATRAGLAARRDAIEIVHGLGAPDRAIAGPFSARISGLAFGGSLLGLILVVPLLIGLAQVSAPFQADAAGFHSPEALLAALPVFLWVSLAALPLAAGLIGWSTAQLTVRAWLRRLP
jgi:cell division transport system permease protein